MPTKLNPILKGLPKFLKDPKNYKGVEQRLRLALVSDHKHSTIKAQIACSRCQKKMERKREVMKEYGFKDFAQLMEWRKVMEIMNNGDFIIR